RRRDTRPPNARGSSTLEVETSARRRTTMRDRKQVIGIALVVLGLLLLLGRGLDFGAMAWPFFVLIPGVIMLAVAFLGDRSSAALAIPGSIVTTIGLI